MKERITIKGDRMIVCIPREVDHCFADDVRELVDRRLQVENIKVLEFDFQTTEFMDSSGVGMIISRYKETTLLGGSVCVAGAAPIIERLFYVSGLHKIIRMYPEVEAVFHE